MAFFVICFIFFAGIITTVLVIGSLLCAIEDKWNTYWDSVDAGTKAARKISEGKIGNTTNIDARQIHLHKYDHKIDEMGIRDKT